MRHYMLQNGVSVPQRTESKIDARFFGPVELDINYQNFSKDADADAAASTLNQVTRECLPGQVRQRVSTC